MNRYHEKHPDPEIRQKFVEWRAAYGDYKARSYGYVNADHQKEIEEKNKKKEDDKKSVVMMLKAIGQQVAFNLSTGKTAKAKADVKKQRRTSGRRGS